MTDCDFCRKRPGVPILPLRYAVARSDVANRRGFRPAPRLQAPFGGGVNDIALPEGQHYTLRLLRQGYLYVLNEARGAWDAYIVTPRGYLFPFITQLTHNTLSRLDPDRTQGDLDRQLQPPATEETIEFSCQREADHANLSRCVLIPNADDAQTIWMSFSETPWTKRVWKQHGDMAVVRSHMRPIDLAAWRSGGDVPHVEVLEKVGERVAEASYVWALRPTPAGVDPNAMPLNISKLGDLDNPWVQERTKNEPSYSPVFKHSLQEVYGMAEQVPGLVEWSKRVTTNSQTRPLMAALDDPTGIASEVNILIQDRAKEWYEVPTRYQKHQTAISIEALRKAVGNGAAEQEYEDRKDRALRVRAFFFWARATTSGVFGQMGSPRWNRLIEEEARMTEEQREAAAVERWERYLKQYDHAGVETYLRQTFPQQLAAFERATLRPLDAAYLKWLQSPVFKRYFQRNFDPRNADSGAAYTQAVYTVLKDATGRKTVGDYLDTCFRADPLDENSIELRALLLNQDALLQPWVEAVGQSLTLDADEAPNWLSITQTLYGALTSILGADAPMKGPFIALAHYIQDMSGPIIKMLGSASDTLVAWGAGMLPEKRLMAMLTTVYRLENPQMALLAVDTQLTRKQSVRALSFAMAGMTGQDEQRFRSEMRNIVDAEYARGGTRYRHRGILVLDAEAAKNLESQLRVPGLARGERDRLIRAALREEEFSFVLRQGANRRINAGVKTGIIGILLAGLTMKSGWDQMMKEGAGANVKTVEFGNAIAAFVGAGFETTAAFLKTTRWGATPLANATLRNMKWLQNRAGMVGFIGKVIGAAGGIVGGIVSIYEGTQEMSYSPGYGVGMICLGLASIVAAVLMFTPFAPLGFILAIIIAAITFIVAFFKPDDIDKWLARTLHYGRLRNNKREAFASFQVQVEAFGKLGNSES